MYEKDWHVLVQVYWKSGHTFLLALKWSGRISETVAMLYHKPNCIFTSQSGVLACAFLCNVIPSWCVLSEALHNSQMELWSKKKKKTQLNEINFTGEVPSWSYRLTEGRDAEDDM